MKFLNEYRVLIETEIEQLDYAHKFPANLYAPMDYILALGGKRMRPVLCLMSAELFGLPPKSALHAAMAVELFHNFSLIHDDIMDEAPLRRGKTTVHKKWNNNIAILSGDAMLVKAYRHLEAAPPRQLASLLRLFNKTAIEVCEGQQLDMDFENRTDVSIADYLKMIELKTAVLLGCSMQFGAIVAEEDVTNQELIYTFGRDLGIAFQLQDDILDVYADASRFGKQVGGDILANKKTFLLLRAFELADEKYRKELNRWMEETERPEEKVKAVTSIYNALNVRSLARAQMNQYYESALTALSKINVSEARKERIQQVAEEIMNREV